MAAHPICRTVAVLAAATLTATMAATAIATEVEAAKAKPNCRGLAATIVGTKGPDRLVGTAKRDVIVGRGGNDVIDGRGGNDVICGGPGADRLIGKAGRDLLYGNLGPDRLFGGVGPDRLFGGAGNDVIAGQVGNDYLRGGPGADTCYQGQGTGAQVSCELPTPPPPPPPAAAPPPPAAAPPSPPPPAFDLTDVLVIAYSDLDGNHVPSPGDVMISQIVDTNGDGTLSLGDTIEMGMYPTTAAPTSQSQFVPWGVESHVITILPTFTDPNYVAVGSSSGDHEWFRKETGFQNDNYSEDNSSGSSDIFDGYGEGWTDRVEVDMASPSQASTDDYWSTRGDGDDKLIDVDFYF